MDNNIGNIITEFDEVMILCEKIKLEKLPIELQLEYLQLNLQFMNNMRDFTNDMKSIIVKAAIFGGIDEQNNEN